MVGRLATTNADGHAIDRCTTPCRGVSPHCRLCLHVRRYCTTFPWMRQSVAADHRPGQFNAARGQESLEVGDQCGAVADLVGVTPVRTDIAASAPEASPTFHSTGWRR